MDSTQQKIITAVEQLDLTGKLRVLKYLNDTNVSISESSDGSRINLDNIPPIQLELLLTYIEELIKDVPSQFRL